MTASSWRPGAGQSYFGHDEFALLAPGMKTIDDAFELRRRVYGTFELAESSVDDAHRSFWLTMVVVGAGPTGVELAGQLRELAGTDPSQETSGPSTRLRCVSSWSTVGRNPWRRSGIDCPRGRPRALTNMGVELLMHTRVVGVDPLGVDLEGPRRQGSAHGRHDDLGGGGSSVAVGSGCWPKRPGARPTGQAASRCCPT